MTPRHTKHVMLAILLSGTFLASPKPAQAFFGPICVPRLQNCMCTYISPCPVFDSAHHATEQANLRILEQTRELFDQIVDSNLDILSNITCRQTAGASLPGLGGIGLNLDALNNLNLNNLIGNLNLDLNSLNIPSITALTQSLQNLGLDPNMLQGLFDGLLDPSQFIDLAALQGINLQDLANIGLPLTAITDLANGNIQTLLSNGMTQIMAQVTNLGIDSNLFNQLVNGSLNLDSFMSQISSQGITQAMLNQIGLNPQAMQSIANGNLLALNELNVNTLLQSHMPRVPMSERMFQDLMTGDATGEQMINRMNVAGLSTEDLLRYGASQDTVNALTSNTPLTAGQVVDLGNATNTQTRALNALGINENLINQIQAGNMAPEALLNIADSVGLTMPDLASLGLDLNTIMNLPQMTEGALMGLFQQMGLSNNILTTLGIDMGVLGQVLEGALPIQQLTDMLNNIGLNLEDLAIPNLQDLLPDLNIPTIPNLSNMLNIPNFEIPGLNNLLGNNCGLSPQSLFDITGNVRPPRPRTP